MASLDRPKEWSTYHLSCNLCLSLYADATACSFRLIPALHEKACGCNYFSGEWRTHAYLLHLRYFNMLFSWTGTFTARHGASTLILDHSGPIRTPPTSTLVHVDCPRSHCMQYNQFTARTRVYGSIWKSGKLRWCRLRKGQKFFKSSSYAMQILTLNHQL